MTQQDKHTQYDRRQFTGILNANNEIAMAGDSGPRSFLQTMVLSGSKRWFGIYNNRKAWPRDYFAIPC